MVLRLLKKSTQIRKEYIAKEYFYFLFKSTERFIHSVIKLQNKRNMLTKFFFIQGFSRCLNISQIITRNLKPRSRKSLPIQRYICHRLIFLRSKFLTKQGSCTLIRNFCMITGRTHSVLRNFSFSRSTFKEMATNGFLGGIKKGSW